LFTSLAVLLIGGYLWRLTSSRSVFLNTVFGSTCMLLASYHVSMHRQMDWAIMLPFFTTMLFGGRALGTWWRSRTDNELYLPARLLAAVATLSLTATVAVFVVA